MAPGEYLWGAPRPAAEPRDRLLLSYGLASWGFSLGLLSVMFVALAGYLGEVAGLLGIALAGILGVLVVRNLFQGLLGGEVRRMFQIRRKRLLGWAVTLGTRLPSIRS